MFKFNVRQVNTKAKIIFVNAITGQGAFMLAKYLKSAVDITDLSDMRLRFTTPASVCSYCTGETRIGEEFQNGMMKKMEFPTPHHDAAPGAAAETGGRKE